VVGNFPISARKREFAGRDNGPEGEGTRHGELFGNQFRSECVVADAVYVERVSATEFPANREINRENRKNGPWVMTRSSFNAASMPVFIDIPYEN
jgi:hypothetical protein